MISLICNVCRKSFDVHKCNVGRYKTCGSRECRQSFRRENNNPNWRGGINKKCPVCETAFWVKPSHAEKRQACSRQCSATLAKTSGRLKGENNPAYGRSYGKHPVVMGRSNFECVECGGTFEVLTRLVRGGRSFCSRKCAIKSAGRYDKTGDKNPNFGNGASIKKENNPNWRGGLTSAIRAFRASRPYLKWRKSVLERDGFACVQCSATEPLDVDHIRPVKTHPHLALDISNGRVLCRTCHLKTPTWGGRKNPTASTA